MKKNNRYIFVSRMFNNYVILFIKDNKLRMNGYNKEFLKFINFKSLKDLDELKINYIVLDNLIIKKKKEFTPNNYLDYYKKYKIVKLLNEIRDVMK